MKAKNIFLVLIALLAISVAACKKDTIADPTPVDPTAPTATVNYVSKSYYFGNIQNSNILDTGEWSHYFYDNLKRLTTIIDTSLEIGVPASTSFDKKSYFYNGNDSFASRFNSISFATRYSRRDTVNSFYFYNALGQLVIDSTIKSYRANLTPTNTLYNKTKVIRSYSYLGNKIFSLTLTSSLPSTNTTNLPLVSRDTFTLDSRGNVMEHRTRSYFTNDIYVIKTYTYDNNRSPFSSFNGGGFTTVTGKNNPLKVKEVESVIGSSNPPGIFETDYTGGYTYNSNGYPVISNFTDVPNQGYQYRNTYIYTTL